MTPPIEDSLPATWLILGPISYGLALTGAAGTTALFLASPSKLLKSARGDKLRLRLERLEREYDTTANLLLILGLCGLGAFVLRSSGPMGWVSVLAAVATLLGIGVVNRLSTMSPEGALLTIDPVLGGLARLLKFPLLVPLHSLTDSLATRFVKPETDTQEENPNEELLTAVRDTMPEAELDEDESYWIGNIVALARRTARATMTPRTDVIAFEGDMPLKTAIRRAVATGYSRYPVYDETIDRVLGLFYAKDLIAMLEEERDRTDVVVRDFIREPLYVNASEGLAEVLQLFRRSKRHMAIVRDEYGGTCGVITVEDILEEIVGDIEDEFDADGHGMVRVLEEGISLDVDGRARLDEINEHLAVKLPEGDDYETVAGWVFTSLERIPETGEEFELGPAKLRILLADQRRIRRLSIEMSPPTEPSANGTEATEEATTQPPVDGSDPEPQSDPELRDDPNG